MELNKQEQGMIDQDAMDDALKTMATAIGSQYFAVYYIWLESRTYVCFQEQLPGILSMIGETGRYEPAWDTYIAGFIEAEDQQGMRDFIEITTLADRIGHKKSISYTYRRKEVGWTRGQFIVGKKDENGKPVTVLYTVSDINEEMELKQKKEKAEQEILHDSLTGLWNRKAFEEYKETKEYKNKSVGLLAFDIDRFKGINDQFGHDMGDQVIMEVARAFRNILRKKDLVFRVGGDEFVALLYNGDESVWKSICRKIETIHEDIKELFPAEMSITISAGLCINTNGYCDEMYRLADQAMYNTKLNGRGGCTQIDLDGKIINEWHDKSSYLRKGDVLEKNSTVTWRMQIPKDKNLPAKLYGDELYNDFFEINKNASPEETYREGVERLEPEYREILNDAFKATVQEGQTEAVYLYNHPSKGKVQLRCSASLEYEADTYYSLVGYIHMLKDIHVFTLEDVNRKIQNSLEELFFCNFYIRLNDYSFKVYKAQPYMEELLGKCKNAVDAVNAYIEYMVADENKEEMKVFLDMTTLKQRLSEQKVLGINYNDPNIGWARAAITVVERNENGEVETVSLVVGAL